MSTWQTIRISILFLVLLLSIFGPISFQLNLDTISKVGESVVLTLLSQAEERIHAVENELQKVNIRYYLYDHPNITNIGG